jgi:pimeloyl-ACP methyl ester carboxylesterase
VIPAPEPRDGGRATSADGTTIAWRRYGGGAASVLFVPTWNLVDSRVVGHQVAALAPHATVVTFDARGSGESDRPPRGYGFSLHAADASAVMKASGLERAAVVTASRGLNAVVLLAAEDPRRVERIAAVAPYMQLGEPQQPDPDRLESWRRDWRGFIAPFMHAVFTEPESEELIGEMVAIGLDASPELVAQQETELDWRPPASRLGEVACPVLVVHGAEDAPVPVALAEAIVARLADARLVVIPRGGHRPDIRSPELVNPILLEFLLDEGALGPGGG